MEHTQYCRDLPGREELDEDVTLVNGLLEVPLV